MRCPFCKGEDTRVVDSRVVEQGDAVRRRRECEACGKRFSTYERAELRLPLVVKKDGGRESFDVGKVKRGMQKALEKRPVAAEQLDAAVNRVLGRVRELGEPEIPSQTLGAFVMDELRRLDGVAYVRFASVYRDFKDVDDFLAAVRAAMGRQDQEER